MKTTDLERSVIRGMVDSPTLLKVGLSALDEDHFIVEDHKVLFEVLRRVAKGGPVDRPLLRSMLPDNPSLAAALDSLGNESVPEDRFVQYMNRLREMRYDRILRGLGIMLSQKPSVRVAEEIGKVLEERRGIRAEDKVDHLAQARETLEVCRRAGVDMQWGLAELDDMLGGLRRKQMYVIGGRTSQGKTTLCLNVILHNLLSGKRALYNGFENIEQVWPRLAAIHSGVSLRAFVNPHKVSTEIYNKALKALDDMRPFKDNLEILEGKNISETASTASQFQPDIIVLDYIQRAAHKAGFGREALMTHQIGEALSAFQDLIIDHNAAGIVVSQLSRKKEELRKARPELSDLKESGNLEIMADGVLLVWWRWRENDCSTSLAEDVYNIIVAKNKTGPIGEISALIDPETLKVSDHEKVGS